MAHHCWQDSKRQDSVDSCHGGARESTCSGGGYNELILNTPLADGLAGAGAFDLDGTLHGIVTPCDGTFRLISVASVSRLLRTFNTPERKMKSTYGFAASQLNTAAKRFFATESGLFVTEVNQGEAAERQGKRTSVRLPSADEAARAVNADSTLGIHVLSPSPAGEMIVVAPGSPAYRSGLRTGDRLIQVRQKRDPSPTGLSRALLQAVDEPVLVLYVRGASERATLVAR
jgi:hypothetical protein